MEYDLYNNVKAVNALNHQGPLTNGTVAGVIIDTKDFESIVFVIQSATITDGTHTVKLEDGDDSGLSDAADVPAADLLGALPAFLAADDNAVKRVGCVTKKRYVRLSIVTTGATTGGSLGATAVQGHPHSMPVA
ncbi:hypothetical protein GWN42_14040 [candidate division KSB1 bacterium]|nr:hypothetical protein [Phycisphaerae bacterium]NIV93874.1 hypothetical protein [candidate division KSB1 bacterium]